MTVAELITQLATLDQTALVYVRGYEGGINDVNGIRAVHVERNHYDEDAWYFGRHEDHESPQSDPPTIPGYQVVA